MTPVPSPQRPPEPPEVTPALRLSAAQWIGIPLLAAIPILSLAGVFGEAVIGRVDRQGPLLVGTSAPARLRYRQRVTLAVSITNQGTAVVNDLRVRIDSLYLDRFSGVSLSPHASPDGAVHFGSLAPSAAVQLMVTLEGDRAGATSGRALVTDAQGDAVHIPLTATVFP